MAAARLALATRVGASSPPVGLEPQRLLRLRQGVRREAWFRLAVLALCGLAATGCGTPAPAVPRRTDAYLYEDTRRLVDFVESAATLIERRGTAAFAEFDRPGGRWRTAPTYLFVYDVEGTCVWHGKSLFNGGNGIGINPRCQIENVSTSLAYRIG